MSLSPVDNAPPAVQQNRPIIPVVKEGSEGMTRQEQDKQRKEQSRFKTGQQLVEGINSIIATATPAADGVKIIQNAMQLPPDEGVWLIRAINQANEWDIFNSMAPHYRDHYVRDALKAKGDANASKGIRGHQSPQQMAGGNDMIGTLPLMPPPPLPPPNQFLSLLKMQGLSGTDVHAGVTHSEAVSGNCS